MPLSLSSSDGMKMSTGYPERGSVRPVSQEMLITCSFCQIQSQCFTFVMVARGGYWMVES